MHTLMTRKNFHLYQNCAHKDENEKGEIVSFPKDIDLNEVIKVIPATTNSMFVSGKKYKDYSFDELRKLYP